MEIRASTQHDWLLRLEGEWLFEGASLLGPGARRELFSGRERVRRLGDFWVVAETESQLNGQTLESVMTLGFDSFRQSFVATWAGSMMPALWVYNGFLDSTGTVLSLETEGPSFERAGKTTKYRDLLTMHDSNSRKLQFFMLSASGRWQEFMNAEYRRV